MHRKRIPRIEYKSNTIDGVVVVRRRKRVLSPIPYKEESSYEEGRRSWGLAVVLLLSLMLNSVGVMGTENTSAFYSDNEETQGNTLVSGSIEFNLDVVSECISLDDSSCNDHSESNHQKVTVINTGNLDFQYTVRSEQTGGNNELCENVLLSVSLEGEEYYSGRLLDFVSDTEYFPESGEWDFSTSFDGEEFSGEKCEFDLVFEGWQLGFPNYPLGFNDNARMSNVFEEKDQEEVDNVIIIENNSTSTIENNVTSTANTGGNSSLGGTIETGDATSTAEVTNIVNTNITNVDLCDADTCDSEDLTTTTTTTLTGSGDVGSTGMFEESGDDTDVQEDLEAVPEVILDTVSEDTVSADTPDASEEVTESSENLPPDSEVQAEPNAEAGVS